MNRKKVILITGASSGFGKNTAAKLLENGHTVYATARRLELMEDLKQHGAHVHKLDVTNDDEVQQVVKEIVESEGRIDVLFNNAGYGSYGAIEAVPLDEIKYQYEVNVFGVAKMTQAVLPHMRAAKRGLIINTSSVVSHVAVPIMGWYCSTKHALKAMTDALRMEVSKLGIDVVLIEPGAVRTGFEKVAFSSLDKIQHPDEYSSLIKQLRNFSTKMYKSAPGPKSTVDDVIKAINAEKPKTRYRTTLDARLLPIVKKILPDRMFDCLMLARLR